MIVLLAKTEIGILTKQIYTVGPILLQTALMTTHPEEVMIALDTKVEIIVIHTDIMMRVRMSSRMVHTGIWIDMGAGIAMMTEAVETMTEAVITGQAVAGRPFGHGHHKDDTYRERGDHYEDRHDRQDDRSWSSRDEHRHDDRGPPTHRPNVNVKLQGTPKEDDSSASTLQTT